MPDASNHDTPERSLAPEGVRVVAIDMLRGFAILWVVLYHLWIDMEFVALPPADYYHVAWDRIADSQWTSVGTAFIDTFFRIGFHGVPLFMMLSGLALYLSASRRPRLDVSDFYRTRLRRILIPYWAGFVVVLAGAAAIAALRVVIDGGSFVDQYHHGVTWGAYHVVDIDWQDALVHAGLFTRLWSNDWFGAIPSSLWFVVVIVQYYLMFPFLRVALDRVGPGAFIVAAFVIQTAGLIAVIAFDGGLQTGELPLYAGYAPFRFFDFALGMTLGHLLLNRRETLAQYIASPLDVAGVVFIGLLLHTGGALIDDRQAYFNALSSSMVIGGLTLIVLPLIVKAPGRLEATVPARILAWTGPISYTVLIANEPIRLLASYLRIKDVPDAWWWLFLTVAYIPATLLLARPLAVVLGLVPRMRREHSAAAATPATPALDELTSA